MHTYPADEQLISAVERGCRCEAIVPAPDDGPVLIGDAVLFAQTRSRAGRPPSFVIGGDSVLVSVTGVTDLGATDPATGQPLIRLAWQPLGQPLIPAKPGRSRRPAATSAGPLIR